MREAMCKIGRAMKADMTIVSLAVAYVVLPICIFFIGWLKPVFGIPFCILFLALAYRVWKEISRDRIELIDRATRSYWITTVLICFFWVYLSGIGGFSYQSDDHWARTAVYNDLCNHTWPVIFHNAQQNIEIRRIVGTEDVMFTYYYTWWLPAAGMAKLLHAGNLLKSLIVLAWAFAGVLLVVYCINRYIGKCSYIVPVVLIGFSGLDIVGNLLKEIPITWIEHLERWVPHVQYSSNTTLLFWVFNQGIPVWLLMGILLQLKDNRSIAAVSSMALAYSPWAVVGLVPIAIVGTVRRKWKDTLSAVNVLNIAVPVIMLLIYGSFYLSGSGGGGAFRYALFDVTEQRNFLCNYLVFIFLEAGVYLWILGRGEWTNQRYYKVTTAELLLIPLVLYVDDYNMIMRASIPPLFLLTVYVAQFLIVHSERKMTPRLAAMLIALAIGACTPLCEINRSLHNTLVETDDEMLRDEIPGFGEIPDSEWPTAEMIKYQFFAEDYQNSFFAYFMR